MTAYYNEIDPSAAAWLRELISAGLIADGEVDERSIEDVFPDDLRGFTQCHFFAGIGGWSRALRLAGWPDDRPVWTGSCPCQPFSAAGKGAAFDDERHLWPAFFHLIEQCKPPVIFGEQVASKAADDWIDLVQADLEGVGYAFGCVPFPSAGIGAPHIRDRNYWMANSSGAGLQWRRAGKTSDGRDAARIKPERFCNAGGVGYSAHESRERIAGGVSGEEAPQHGARVAVDWHLSVGSEHAGSGVAGRLADSDNARLEGRQGTAERALERPAWSRGVAGRLADTIVQQRPDWQSRIRNEHDESGRHESAAAPAGLCGDLRPGPTNGFWRDADWLLCRDGKWRPVEPGTFPLAHGVPARVVRLRGYGNAINPEQAAIFIKAAEEAMT